MASRRQQRLRRHIFAGYLLAICTFTGWIGLSAWAGHITAEQPAAARYLQDQHHDQPRTQRG